MIILSRTKCLPLKKRENVNPHVPRQMHASFRVAQQGRKNQGVAGCWNERAIQSFSVPTERQVSMWGPKVMLPCHFIMRQDCVTTCRQVNA